ncbi:hypothetical protein BH09ACT8_BH09ACT8_55490 [soil metagenome]
MYPVTNDRENVAADAIEHGWTVMWTPCGALAMLKGGDLITARFEYQSNIDQHVLAAADLHVADFGGHLLSVSTADEDLVAALDPNDWSISLAFVIESWLQWYGHGEAAGDGMSA